MMPTKDEFFEPGNKRELFKIEYAKVADINESGEPLLQFFGETTTSPKTYPRMRHYVPQIGDRVRLIDDIIDGTWTNVR